MWEGLSQFLQSLARQRPVTMLLDDLHWADAATVGLMGYLARRAASPALVLLVTARPVAVESALGDLPIVAENLGVITAEVEAIRHRFYFPGMAILQFAFGTDPQGPTFRPHNYPRELVAYTGTHDNDTIVGWWTGSGAGDSTRTEEDIHNEREYASKYLNTDGREIHWDFIRALLASVAETVIFPLQDVMGLGSEARMNTPSKLDGNWRWRFRGEMLTEDVCRHLKELTMIYERLQQV